MAIYSFSKMELSSSSADLLPDSSVKLQKMSRGMDLAPFSRLFFIDIYQEEGNVELLEQSAQIIEKSVPKHIAIALHEQASINPNDLMQFLPNFFTDEAEIKAYKSIEEHKAKSTLDTILQQLSTFAPASLAKWLRIDPFNFKESILSALPYSFSQNQDSFSSSNFVYSADKKHILLTFQPLVSIHDTNAAAKLLESVREVAKTLDSSIEINFNGGIVHTAVNTQVIEKDIKNVLFFSLLGLILLYILLVRRLSGIWLLLTPALAVSLSLGVLTSFSAVVSGLALGFGSAVLGIAEDYAVHIHCALEKEKNIDKILNILTIPLFQGFILNISGFAVLTFSSLPAIRQLAYFALLSLCFGFLIAIFILPLCPRFANFSLKKLIKKVERRKVENRNEESQIQAEEKPIQSQEITSPATMMEPVFLRCVLTVSALLIISFYLFTHTKVDVSPRSMGVSLDFADTNSQKFAQTWGSNSSNTDSDLISDLNSDTSSNTAPSANFASLYIVEALNEEELFDNSRKISEELNSLLEAQRSDKEEKINKVDTIAHFFPSKLEQEENIKRFNIFVDKNKDYIQKLLEEKSQEFSLPSSLFSPFISVLNTKASLLTTQSLKESSLSPLLDFFVLKKQIAGKEIFSTLLISKEKLNIHKESFFSDTLVELSPQALESEILSSFYDEARYLPLALLLCSIILYFFYFNIAKTLLALTPALFSLFSVLLGMYILQSPLTLGALTALLLVIGLALDHGILVSCDLEKGIDFNLRRALFISSLSTILGIGLLAFATHPTLRDMGRIILLGLLMEVPVSLYLLPLLCKKKYYKENLKDKLCS